MGNQFAFRDERGAAVRSDGLHHAAVPPLADQSSAGAHARDSQGPSGQHAGQRKARFPFSRNKNINYFF